VAHAIDRLLHVRDSTPTDGCPKRGAA
jgi:hypothetical protein